MITNKIDFASRRFNEWRDPERSKIAGSIEPFLEQLRYPTAIYLRGRQAGARRAVVTLLRANETAGLKAIHRFLKEGETPLYDTLLILASVDTALVKPYFSRPFLSGERDLGRAFTRPPGRDYQGQLAADILELLDQFDPDSVVDIQSLTCSGPSYSIAKELSKEVIALATVFSNRLLVDGEKRGAFREGCGDRFPVASLECGGSSRSDNGLSVYRDLHRYLNQENVTSLVGSQVNMEIITSPITVALKPELTLSFGSAQNPQADLIVDEKLQGVSFVAVDQEQVVGKIGHSGLKGLSAHNIVGKDIVSDLFRVKNNHLMTAKPLTILMVAASTECAATDGLFKVVCPN